MSRLWDKCLERLNQPRGCHKVSAGTTASNPFQSKINQLNFKTQSDEKWKPPLTTANGCKNKALIKFSNYVGLHMIWMNCCRWWGKGIDFPIASPPSFLLHSSSIWEYHPLDGWTKELSKFIWIDLMPAPWAAGRTQTFTKQNGNFHICTCSLRLEF